MPSPHRSTHLMQWLMPRLGLPLLVLNGWVVLLLLNYFKVPVRILLVGSIVAFLLEPPLQWLEHHRIKRGPAIGLLVIGAVGLLAILGVTVLPLVSQQAQNLMQELPLWQRSAQQQVEGLQTRLVGLGLPINIQGLARALGSQLDQQLRAITMRLPEALAATVGSVFEFFLIGVVGVYLLLRGESLWQGIFEWWPGPLGQRVKITLPRSFRNYFIGQGTVALVLGTGLAVGFTLFRIPYGALFGILIGMLALFPYGGTLGIILVSLLLALKSIGLGVTVLAIATVVDQVVENGLAPRLMGHLTGVHPVWVVMAILLGGRVAGLLGVVLAVPIASTVKEVMEPCKPKQDPIHRPQSSFEDELNDPG
ncbi:MAG TPA: AI-2E family transporter [Leptolyngbyaceae cyanobacterium M65_K2018_010]|nr:AI-2E family transporter [Leptolyngbyaceae cyanobacterium M65_K2018_010]